MFRFFILLIILLITPMFIFAQELDQEELEKLEGYGQTAYTIYLIGLILLAVGVIIAGLLIQNNFGTKKTLIFVGIIISIALLIMFY